MQGLPTWQGEGGCLPSGSSPDRPFQRSKPPPAAAARRLAATAADAPGAWCARAPGAPPRASLVLGQRLRALHFMHPFSLTQCSLLCKGPVV
ncbi:hypothetical protein BDA96_06G051800 [Sorghum bicolor]|uniref:Uncharacterized protein n=1 Tax=Sorghum bicolor TaxID=4558 RepID=A0A921QNM8_SORBI|nr:hypothetical protein BDA96_06G051800 [Sorghum bicolor]